MKVIVVAAGEGCAEQLDSFDLIGKATVEEAVRTVNQMGYAVVSNDAGGRNEICTAPNGENYISITVEPRKSHVSY